MQATGSTKPSSKSNKKSEMNSLHEAARAGNAAQVEHLLASGANVNLHETGSKLTALHIAVQHNHIDVVHMLLNKRPRVNAQDANGDTPLHEAVRRKLPELVELLLRRGANPNIPMSKINANGKRSKRAARTVPLFTALENEDAESMPLLLQFGARADVFNRDNESPLYVAIRVFDNDIRRYTICRRLMAKRAQVNPMNRRYSTRISPSPLYLAIEARGDSELAELLVERGADVNANGPGRRSPLHAAVRGRFMTLVLKLLEAGAKPNVLDRQGRSVLVEAVYTRDEGMVRLLLDHGADCKKDQKAVFLTAASMNDGRIMKLMLSRGVNVNDVYTESTGETVSMLHYALRYGSYGMVEFLLENGADVNLELDGLLPLIYARHRFYPRHNAYNQDPHSPTLIVKHCARLAAQGKYVHEDNVTFIRQNAEMNDQYESCRLELESMKVAELCDDSSVTYFDLLTKRGNVLLGYLRCEGVRRALHCGRFRTQYPEYADELRWNCCVELRRLQMMDEVQEMLHNVFNCILPYDVTKLIADEYVAISA